MDECTYCGCDVSGRSPVVVFEGVDTDRPADRSEEGGPAGADDADRRRTGRFCNYGCLAAHVEEAGLATGTACRVDPQRASRR